MNDQPRINCQLPVAPAGDEESDSDRLSNPWSDPGLKSGSTHRRTRGMIVRMPNTVAKVAPSRIPSQQGMNITSNRITPTTNTSTGTSAPNFELIGPNEPPKSMLKRSTM